jgi:hypothetical protein
MISSNRSSLWPEKKKSSKWRNKEIKGDTWEFYKI